MTMDARLNRYELSEQISTPEFARELLRHLPAHQRRRMAAYAEQLADAFRRGEFTHSPQPIILDTAGNVLDGQHRLLACVLSGISFGAVIVRGVPADMFDKIDIGRKRLAAQFVTGAYANQVTASARLTMAYHRSGGTMRDLHRLTVTATITQVLAEIAARPELEKLVARVEPIRKSSGVPLSPLLAVTALGSPVGDLVVNEWITGLATGAELYRGDPRLALREVFAGQSRAARSLRVSSARRQSWGLIVKAWNAHVGGATVHLLRFRAGDRTVPGENMPLIVGAVLPVGDPT
jgi:hypothetical protein